MKIKQMLLLLVAVATLAFATGCGDPKDGNTSGSAESNGVISENTNSVTNSKGDGDPSKETSDTLGDDLSDIISDSGDVVSDVVSDVEEGISDAASDLFGDDGSDARG